MDDLIGTKGSSAHTCFCLCKLWRAAGQRGGGEQKRRGSRNLAPVVPKTRARLVLQNTDVGNKVRQRPGTRPARRPRSERTTLRESLTMRRVEPSPGGWSGQKGESAWSRPNKEHCCYSESSKVQRLERRASARLPASGVVSGEKDSAQSRASVSYSSGTRMMRM